MKGLIIFKVDESEEIKMDSQIPTEFINLPTLEKLKNVIRNDFIKNLDKPKSFVIELNEEIRIINLYSGRDFKHFIGKPNYILSLFLDARDDLKKDYEGMLRRFANEVLPKREARDFNILLSNYYRQLKGFQLEPFWNEIVEGEFHSVKKKLYFQEKEFLNLKNKEDKNSFNEYEDKLSDMAGQENILLKKSIEEKEMEISKLHINNLKLASEVAEKDEIIKTLNEQLDDLTNSIENMKKENENLEKVNKEISSENVLLKNKMVEIERELNKLREEELNTTDLKSKLSNYDSEIENYKRKNDELNKIIKKLEKKYSELQYKFNQLNETNDIHLETITNLKLKIKNLKRELDLNNSKVDALNEQIIELKKEIKILRRERDHYLEILKEHNLF